MADRDGDGQVIWRNPRPQMPESIGGSRGFGVSGAGPPRLKGDTLGQQSKQPLEVGFISRQHIEGHQHHRSLLRRQNARLMPAIEWLLSGARRV